MKCADPVLCYTDGKTRKFRHFSLSGPVFKILHNQVFDCGKCIFCRKKKSMELAVRCVLHASLYPQNCFLTLTYDEKKEGYHNDFEYSDIQKFKKRLQRYCSYHFKKRIQCFNVHEYGKNGKKHWHLVVFNHDFSDKELHTVAGGHNLYTSKVLSKLWPHGFSTIGSVTEASAMYQAQYTQKDLKNGNLQNKKKAHSQHSGIGRDFFLKHYSQILSLGFIPFAGRKIPVPRYFQKLAHKHWAHFNQPDLFFDIEGRKAVYRPFKSGQENKEISDLFELYSSLKLDRIETLTKEWNDFIETHLFDVSKTDFQLSAENFLYDLSRRLDSKRL